MRRPRGIEYTSDDELPMVGGHADGMHHPFDLEGDEQEALASELREQLARRRPCGFQAVWPDRQVEQ